MKKLFILLSILFSLELYGNSLVVNSWEEMEGKQEQVILIRGFLYKTNDNQWILAKEPDLKSCCVGSSNKAKTQVFLEGDDFSQKSTSKVTLISGILHKQKNASNQEYYWLSEAQIVQKNANLAPFYTLLVVAILFFCFFRLAKSKKKAPK